MVPRKLLLPGEEIVLELRPHPVALAAPAIALVAATAIVVWVADRFDGFGVWIVCAAWVALVLGFVAPRLVAWWTSIFVVSSDRVISREGFIAKRSMEIPLEQVNDVRFEQGIFDRIVGAGTLLIQSASTGGTNSFEDIRKPEDVQRTIFHQGELNQRRSSAPAPPSADDAPARPDAASPAIGSTTGSPLSPSVTTELERLADLRARGMLTEDEFQAQKARILGRG
ncbi:MAG TPA: PH domain-containing protein [Actinomycetota bacterium]|nr:PH domain-containing protein [Actinomycetota bacterium]